MNYREISVAHLHALEKLVLAWEKFDENKQLYSLEGNDEINFCHFMCAGLAWEYMGTHRAIRNRLMECQGCDENSFDDLTQYLLFNDEDNKSTHPVFDVMTELQGMKKLYLNKREKGENVVFRILPGKSLCTNYLAGIVKLDSSKKVKCSLPGVNGDKEIELPDACFQIGGRNCKDAKSARQELNKLIFNIKKKKVALKDKGDRDVSNILGMDEIFTTDDQGVERINPHIDAILEDKVSKMASKNDQGKKGVVARAKGGHPLIKLAVATLLIGGVIATAVCVGVHFGTGRI